MAQPHQTMFLAGGSWAIVGVAGVSWKSAQDLLPSPIGGIATWHAHEMVFGFAAAMFAGYALTAMKAWSRQAAMSPRAVAVLFVSWVAARIATAGGLGQDPRVVIPAAVGFMALVTLWLARAALRARVSRAFALALFALLLTAMQIAMLRDSLHASGPVLGFAALLSLIGGRMVAAFTRNLVLGPARQLWRFSFARLFGTLGTGAILAALCLTVSGFGAGWLRPCLLFAAGSEALRLWALAFRDGLKDGLALMLHLGFVWLPTGLLLIAQRGPGAGYPAPGAALHGLAAGAVACSIHAVAARAVAQRTPRLRASAWDYAGFAILWAAAALRVFAPAGTAWYAAAPFLWCLAWGMFLARHGAALTQPPPRPVFSGPKRQDT